ncbi:hypothetical protein [Thermaerobacter subterraneus]|uniref:Uncharacterized protein n=1 Tax=Thermaerobacter subterraneus DSM 13965 TaxID=867903 RepID=K6QCW0_9FIRM|nr:hypothetical protein [Thermaerobacter subterraneus]EKP94421.1 hypothetical protein ThesuDRAFT_02156 [Thermaerobacter subterraneus DSM 13965]
MQVLVRHRWLVDVDDTAGIPGWVTVLERLGHRVWMGGGGDGPAYAAVDSALHGRTVILQVTADEPGPRTAPPAAPGGGPGPAAPQPGGPAERLAEELATILQRAGVTVVQVPAGGAQQVPVPQAAPARAAGAAPPGPAAGTGSPSGAPAGSGAAAGSGGAGSSPAAPAFTRLAADVALHIHLDAVSLRGRVATAGRRPWRAWWLGRHLARSLWEAGCLPVHQRAWPRHKLRFLVDRPSAGGPEPLATAAAPPGPAGPAGPRAMAGAPGSGPPAGAVVLVAPLAASLTLPAGWPAPVVAAALYSGLVAFYGGPRQPVVPWARPALGRPETGPARAGNPGGPAGRATAEGGTCEGAATEGGDAGPGLSLPGCTGHGEGSGEASGGGGTGMVTGGETGSPPAPGRGAEAGHSGRAGGTRQDWDAWPGVPAGEEGRLREPAPAGPRPGNATAPGQEQDPEVEPGQPAAAGHPGPPAEEGPGGAGPAGPEPVPPVRQDATGSDPVQDGPATARDGAPARAAAFRLRPVPQALAGLPPAVLPPGARVGYPVRPPASRGQRDHGAITWAGGWSGLGRSAAGGLPAAGGPPGAGALPGAGAGPAGSRHPPARRRQAGAGGRGDLLPAWGAGRARRGCPRSSPGRRHPAGCALLRHRAGARLPETLPVNAATPPAVSRPRARPPQSSGRGRSRWASTTQRNPKGSSPGAPRCRNWWGVSGGM